MPKSTERKAAPSQKSARERILDAAYDLFSRQGIAAVGIEAIVERSGVTRVTLYRHFRSKRDLVLAFLAHRDQMWTRQWLIAEVTRRESDSRRRLLAIFDVLHEWFRKSDFEGCSFVRTLLESAGDADIQRAAAQNLANICSFLATLATEAGLPKPESFAATWQSLMIGATVLAYAGNRDAARQARPAAEVMLENWSSAAPAPRRGGGRRQAV